jgi:hypothetical protein
MFIIKFDYTPGRCADETALLSYDPLEKSLLRDKRQATFGVDKRPIIEVQIHVRRTSVVNEVVPRTHAHVCDVKSSALKPIIALRCDLHDAASTIKNDFLAFNG